MKRSMKARAVAMGAMLLLQMNYVPSYADLVDDGFHNYRFTTDAPNPFPFQVTLTVNTLLFEPGAELAVVGMGSAINVTSLAGGGLITLQNGASISLDSFPGAAVYLQNGAVVNNSGTIEGTAAWGLLSNGDSNVSNQIGGVIRGASAIVIDSLSSMTIVNRGQLTGTSDHALIGYTGTLHISNEAGGVIQAPGLGKQAVYIDSATLVLENNGVIEGDGMGVYVQNSLDSQIINSGNITGFQSPAIRLRSGTISNNAPGLIQSGAGEAIYLDLGGTVNNAAGAQISGETSGIRAAGTALTVTNSGFIRGWDNAGIVLEHGGMVTNLLGGSIRGANSGIDLDNQFHGDNQISNRGLIIGENGAMDGIGIIVKNGGALITNFVSGVIQGNDTGIATGSGISTVDNSGSILGGVSGEGISMTGSGIIHNRSGASIAGGSGVAMNGGGLFNHAGAVIEAEATSGYGVSMGASGQISNAGQILAVLDGGIGLRHAGGGGFTSIHNAETGLIRAHGTAVHVTNDINGIWNSGDIISTHGVGIMTLRCGESGQRCFGGNPQLCAGDSGAGWWIAFLCAKRRFDPKHPQQWCGNPSIGQFVYQCQYG